MTSPCLINGGGRTYNLNLEIITKSSPTHSSISSTLSESINSSPFFISTKRSRSPRKRPNQISAEAAILLSTISPKLFSPTILHRRANCFPLHPPSFDIVEEANLLLTEAPLVEKFDLQISDSSACRHPCLENQGPGSPEFDVECILRSEVEEGIESIMGMGELSMSSNCIKDGNLDWLMGFGGLGFGFGISTNSRRALRVKDEGEWRGARVVDVKDILPEVKTKMKTKMKKKKKKEKVKKDIACGSFMEDGNLGPLLWLKLDYNEVIKEWAGGSPFFGETVSMESSTNVIERLASIDLFPNGEDGALTEASLQRQKEKQRVNVIYKKIGCQVRKGNCVQRSRLKGNGRFTRTSSLLQETIEEKKPVNP